jgi:hypothetical protein
MRFRTPELFLGAFLTVAIFAMGMIFTSSYHPRSSTNNQVQQTETAATIDRANGAQSRKQQEGSSEFWTAKLTDWLLAIFTALLVAFTYRLWKSTEKLWSAGEKQIRQMRAISLKQDIRTEESLRLAREEFIATHRPKVIVRFIQGPFIENGGQFVWVTVCNVGVNKATIREWGGDLARRQGKTWLTPGADGGPNAIVPIVLISGQRHVFTVSAKTAYGDTQRLADTWETEELCAFGIIRYTDENDIIRETGFFRVYDRKSEAFVPSKDAEDEYQD